MTFVFLVTNTDLWQIGEPNLSNPRSEFIAIDSPQFGTIQTRGRKKLLPGIQDGTEGCPRANLKTKWFNPMAFSMLHGSGKVVLARHFRQFCGRANGRRC